MADPAYDQDFDDLAVEVIRRVTGVIQDAGSKAASAGHLDDDAVSRILDKVGEKHVPEGVNRAPIEQLKQLFAGASIGGILKAQAHRLKQESEQLRRCADELIAVIDRDAGQRLAKTLSILTQRGKLDRRGLEDASRDLKTTVETLRTLRAAAEQELNAPVTLTAGTRAEVLLTNILPYVYEDAFGKPPARSRNGPYTRFALAVRDELGAEYSAEYVYTCLGKSRMGQPRWPDVVRLIPEGSSNGS